MDHFDVTDPAFPCDDFDPSEEQKFFGLTKMDYAMIHIMSGMLASGQYNCAADIADLVRNEAYELAKAALSVSKNI
jgi:hypothetical protein